MNDELSALRKHNKKLSDLALELADKRADLATMKAEAKALADVVKTLEKRLEDAAREDPNQTDLFD